MTQNDLHDNQGYYHQPAYRGDIGTIEEKFIAKVSDLATSIFWLVIPSLVFFISLPVLLKKGVEFYLSMGLSMSVTAGCYFLMIALWH